MHVRLDLIYLYIYFIDVVSGTPDTTKWIGFFKVVHKHQKLVQCARHLFPKEDEYRAFTVSDTTCGVLFGPSDKEAVKPGYGYAKLYSEKKRYQPLFQLPTDLSPLRYKFPAAFNTGSRFNVHFIWPDKTMDSFYLDFYEDNDEPENVNMFGFSINQSWKQLIATEVRATDFVDMVDYKEPVLGAECTLSFVSVNNNAIKILFNGKSMLTWVGLKAKFDRLAAVDMYLNENKGPQLLLIQGLDFIEG